MGSKSDTYENAVLDKICNAGTIVSGTVYSALFTVIPSDSTGGTEVTNAASGYTRVATTFCAAGATTAGSLTNTGAVTFATAAAAYTVVGWALMSTAAAGTVTYWATVTTLAIAINDQAVIAVGGIVITED